MDTSKIAATGFFFRPITNVFPTCSRRSAGGPAGRTGRGAPSGIRAGASTCAETGVRTVIFCSGMRVMLTVVAPVSRLGVANPMLLGPPRGARREREEPRAIDAGTDVGLAALLVLAERRAEGP